MAHYSGEGGTPIRIITLNASHTECVVFGKQPVFSGLASVCADGQTYQSTKKLPKLNRVLCYDLTRWIITSRVGSLFKLGLSAYQLINTIGSKFSKWRLNFCRQVREIICSRLAQFREQWNIIRLKVVRAWNYPPKHIPHGACCVRKPANVVWSSLGLRKCPNPWVDQRLPN